MAKEKQIVNLAASIHQRLLNQARAKKRPFKDFLQRYAVERFLYRLSRSSHADKFILKGGLMLYAWGGAITRTTKDIDFLGYAKNDTGILEDIVKEVCDTPVEPDGMTYDRSTVKAEEIVKDADYHGIRIVFRAYLGKADNAMQIDIGFGDTVSPAPTLVSIPPLLDLPGPELKGYTMESTIAEKFHAMVKHRELNSRMKDFYDIWLLSHLYDFEGEKLAEAIRATFGRRDTEIDASPSVFTPAFAEESRKQTQWRAFLSNAAVSDAPSVFPEVIASIRAFLKPVVEALAGSDPFRKTWPAAGPWQ